MAPPFKGWQVSKKHHNFWAPLETRRQNQRAAAEEEAEAIPERDPEARSRGTWMDDNDNGSRVHANTSAFAGAVMGAGAGNGGSNGGGGGAGMAGSSREARVARLPQALQHRFSEAQGILEHNRRLIQEINQNERSRDPDRLARNASLLHELNTNVSRVVGIYADLSGSFNRPVAAKNARNAAAAAAAASKDSPRRPPSADRE
ncbi:hypothetical protein ACP4OV_023549 [Aristida adscensionis]